MSRHENPPVSLLRKARRLELHAMGYTARHAARKVVRKPARVTAAVAIAAVGAVVAAGVASSASGHTAAQSAADARAELTSKSMLEPPANAFAANHAGAPATAKGNDSRTHTSAATDGSGKHAAAAAKPAPAKPAPAKPAPAKPHAAAAAKPAPAKPHAAAAAKPAHAKAAPAKPAPPWIGPSTFYDSVLPQAIPAGQWAAVYSDGKYQASLDSLAGRKTLLWIDAHGTNPTSNALDIEPGDATPAGAADWVRAKLTMNPSSTAILYTFKGDWGEVQANIAALPSWMHSHVRYWIADPTGYPHIVPGSSATQWYWGPTYDISQANPDFYS